MHSIYKNEQEVIDKLQSLIKNIANESINARGKFFIGFSGEWELKSNLFVMFCFNKFPILLLIIV